MRRVGFEFRISLLASVWQLSNMHVYLIQSFAAHKFFNLTSLIIMFLYMIKNIKNTRLHTDDNIQYIWSMRCLALQMKAETEGRIAKAAARHRGLAWSLITEHIAFSRCMSVKLSQR
jgi:hypothetical protein